MTRAARWRVIFVLLLPACVHRAPSELLTASWHIEQVVDARAFRTGESDEEIFDRRRGVLFVYGATVARSREDASLELRRAVIASAMYTYDLEARWSEQEGWRSLNGWRGFMNTALSPLPHAANQDPRGFADPRGRRSPRWDLAAFAAHFFTGDRAAQCRLLAQSRFLVSRFRELGAHVEMPQCPAFERWARIEHVRAVEVNLAAPTSASLGSLFGHLFMTVVEDRQTRAIAFLAEARGILEEDPLYPLKGIFGAYEAALYEKSFLDLYRDYVIAESRQIRRWRVSFTRPELVRFMESIWTRLHSARYTYYFFAQNCATLLLDLFNGTRPEGQVLVPDGSLGRGPASVLDALALARDDRGEPLLRYVPEPFASYEGAAQRARGERRQISARLAEHDELAPSLEIVEGAADARQRAPAYERISRRLIAIDPADASAWLRASAEIEVHLSAAENLEEERALYQKRKREGRELLNEYRALFTEPRVVEALERLDDGDEEARFRGYRELASLLGARRDPLASSLRLYTLVAADLSWDAIKKRDPALHAALFLPERGRPLAEQTYVRGFEHLVEYSFVTKVSPALLAVQRAKQQLRRAEIRSTSQEEEEEEDEEDRRASELAHYEGAYAHTGVDTLGLGAAVHHHGAFTFVLRGAVYDEALGDQRRHGFPAHSAFTFLRTEAHWWRGAGFWPEVAESHTRIAGYRAMKPGSTLGFELYADLDSRGDALFPGAGVGGIVPLARSDSCDDFVIAAFGLAYGARLPAAPDRDAHETRAPLSLEARKSLGGPMHALRGVFTVRPQVDLISWTGSLALAAQAELRVQLFERADLWIDPHAGVALVARAEWERDGGGGAEELSAELGLVFD